MLMIQGIDLLFWGSTGMGNWMSGLLLRSLGLNSRAASNIIYILNVISSKKRNTLFAIAIHQILRPRTSKPWSQISIVKVNYQFHPSLLIAMLGNPNSVCKSSVSSSCLMGIQRSNPIPPNGIEIHQTHFKLS